MSANDVIDLNELASRTMSATDKLRLVSMRLHGHEDVDKATGEVTRTQGVKIEFEEKLDEELLAIAEPFIDAGKRPPAEDIRTAQARKRVKEKYPDLWDEVHILEATMRRLERWLRDARSATMARQSVLKTERELASQGRGSYQ